MADTSSPQPPGDADADVAAGDAPASRRVRLDRRRIVAAATEFIDTEGLAGLTMRRLGDRLGVEAMSLYRYVAGREELLDQVVAAVLAELTDDPEVLDRPEHGWQDFLQRLAHGVRRLALAHPEVFPLVAARPAGAPWLRPPLRSLAWVESFLVGLAEEGFSEEEAVAAYRGFTSFLLGHLLLEVSTHGADVGPLDVLAEPDDPADSPLADYPTVHRLREQLSEDRAAVEFDDALESLLERLATVRHRAAPPDGVRPGR